jgi:hypothetical protein
VPANVDRVTEARVPPDGGYPCTPVTSSFADWKFSTGRLAFEVNPRWWLESGTEAALIKSRGIHRWRLSMVAGKRGTYWLVSRSRVSGEV